MDNNYRLGEFLKDKRKEKGFSLKDVEDKIEVSASYLNRLEKGNRQNPSIFILEKLSTFYEVEPKHIMALAGLECEQEGSNNKVEIMSLNHVSVNGMEIPVNEFREIVDVLATLDTSNFLSIANLVSKIRNLQNLLS